MKLNTFTLASAAVALASVGAALPANANDYPFAIDTVLVGDMGNPADAVNPQSDHFESGKGSVSYQYRIGTYMVTQEQYVQFLNELLAETGSISYGLDTHVMPPNGFTTNAIGFDGTKYFVKQESRKKTPVSGVTFWDAARFCNWMTNRKLYGTNDTETGMYTLSGNVSTDASAIAREGSAWNSGGVALPTEDEWHKAAYYDPTANAGSGAYWTFATTAARKAADPNANDDMTTAYANYYDNGFAYSSQGYVVDAGFFGSYPSYYGAVGITGNLWEWVDGDSRNSIRRGGAFDSNSNEDLKSYRGNLSDANLSDYRNGFRVVSLEVIPEPSEFGLMAGAALGLVCLVRRRKRARA